MSSSAGGTSSTSDRTLFWRAVRVYGTPIVLAIGIAAVGIAMVMLFAEPTP